MQNKIVISRIKVSTNEKVSLTNFVLNNKINMYFYKNPSPSYYLDKI